MNKALIIFARQPVSGKVKTRLARQLGEQVALELYIEMLADVLTMAASLEDVRPIVFWALEAPVTQCLHELSPLESALQHGTSLGERMADAFRRSFDGGSDVCCIIGSDSPDLPAAYIRQAFEVLEQDEADVVFGPSEDGGYYLLGMRRVWAGLFRDIPWGSSRVLQASLSRALELGLRVVQLPSWYDIDTPADLQRLAQSPEAKASRTLRMLLRCDSYSTLQAG